MLSTPLVDWFDDEIWRHIGLGEFREPIHPSVLVGPSPGCIWPALMPCDLLPMIGNTAGDWLCVRVDAQNNASQIVHWYHGGGDWIPWGKDLAEALFLDAVIDRLPGESSRHAIPAEDPRPSSPDGDTSLDPTLSWALQHLRPDLRAVVVGKIRGHELAEVLLQHGVAEIAVGCELILAVLGRLESPRREAIREAARAESKRTRTRWEFDNELIPEEKRKQIRPLMERSMPIQDWEVAAEQAERVNSLTTELAWSWDTIGYAAERRGDLPSAKHAYQKGARCSVFTDQSIRLETHWTAERAAKFSAARLSELFPEEVSQSRYLSLLCEADPNQRRHEATTYWTETGNEQMELGQFADAYESFVASGWDIGAEPMGSYAGILERIATAAQQAGQSSRAEIASTHRRCLRQRYGV